MGIKSFLQTILKSVNPYAYHDLTTQKVSHAIRYFGALLFFTLLLTLIIFIPQLFLVQEHVTRATSRVSTLSGTIDFSVENPFILTEDPLIVVSPNESVKGAMFVITPDTFYYHSLILFGKIKEVPLRSTLDFKTDTDLGPIIGAIIFLLIPALFFWAFVGFAVYFWIIIVFMFIIGMLIVWIARIPMRPKTAFLSAIYASTVLVILQLILLPFYRMIYLPILVYLILYVLVIVVYKIFSSSNVAREYAYGTRDRIFDDDRAAAPTRSTPKPSKQEDIWGKSKRQESSQSEFSSPKRKKSVDEENEGYVMLK